MNKLLQKSLLLIWLPLLLAAGALFTGCAKQAVEGSDFVLNTIAKITIYEGGKDPEAIIDGAFDLCRSEERIFSRTVSGSEIDQINQAGGAPVEVSTETAALLKKALDYAVLSDGRFDITIAPVSGLWDFTAEEPKAPDHEAVAAALTAVDYRGLSVEGTTVTLKNPSAAIDLGGIAKGYIADKCAAYLREQGVTSAIVDLGGNIVTIGQKTDGTDFNIGVQAPFSQSLAAVVPSRDGAVVTSGVYERFFEEDGVRYHHILDPETGYPADTGLLSVTILTESAVDADALSTTCFLLGLEDGLALAEKLEGVEAIFIDEDRVLHATSGADYKEP